MLFENSKPKLTLGYDLDAWNGYGAKIPVTADVSQDTNSHTLLCGMSGSGKSYATQMHIAKLKQLQPNSEFYFADYKGEDAFHFLKSSLRYYSYKQTVNALDAVYDKLNARLSGEDSTRHPIILVWDEYMANILALIGEDKKVATATMNKISECLLLGRSMNVRLISTLQRPDAIAFPVGSRLNYGIIVILGAYIRSIYEMLLPDHMEQVKGRQFGRGEGVALLQGSELHFIKIPQVRDYARMQELCIQALS